MGANAVNLLLAPSAADAWLFIDPADLGAFSACWACCMARLLWRVPPSATVLGEQPGLSLARADAPLVGWALGLVAEASGASSVRATTGDGATGSSASRVLDTSCAAARMQLSLPCCMAQNCCILLLDWARLVAFSCSA